jgi:hypothetical protein
MQYPELNIGEFAIKNSAQVDLKREDEGYVLTVSAEPREGEEGYPISISARPQTVRDLGELYREHFTDFPSGDLTTVYGSDKAAMNSIVGKDVWARFERPVSEEEEQEYRKIISEPSPEAREDIMAMEDPDYKKLLNMEREGRNRIGLKVYIKRNMREKGIEDVYEPKGWAVDIESLLRAEDDYEKFAERISAATLHVVNRAESDGEVGVYVQEFHRDIIRELRAARKRESVVVEVEEGTESRIDYEEFIAGSISDSKKRIEEVKDQLGDEDWEALLEAEREGEDRKTFKPYLEEHLGEEGEG